MCTPLKNVLDGGERDPYDLLSCPHYAQFQNHTVMQPARTPSTVPLWRVVEGVVVERLGCHITSNAKFLMSSSFPCNSVEFILNFEIKRLIFII